MMTNLTVSVSKGLVASAVKAGGLVVEVGRVSFGKPVDMDSFAPITSKVLGNTMLLPVFVSADFAGKEHINVMKNSKTGHVQIQAC